MIKQHLQMLIQSALSQLQHQAKIVLLTPADIQIERARDKQYGDFASNIALILAKVAGKNPRLLAEEILVNLPASAHVKEVTIAGPGFINFTLNDYALHEVVKAIFSEGKDYGRCQLGQGRRVNVEYLSCNPTGPLHVGHGRGAALGTSLANLLKLAGYEVCQEYLINDAGRQIDILAVSLWLRYLQLYAGNEDQLVFPSNGYQGDYIKKIAEDLQKQYGDQFYHSLETVFANIPLDEPQGGDKEVHIDALITRAKDLLSEKNYFLIHQFSKDQILADIKQDLSEYGVNYDVWFSEQALVASGAIQRAIEKLQHLGCTYEKDGALWFNAIHFGDEKDRVLVRANGQTTYFASDVAYHMNKFERGFDLIIDTFGADHHGYLTRVLASMAALGYDRNAVKILIYQFVALYRGKESVPMSTRKGAFVTLRQLREEVGNDAARFFYLMRKSEQPIDFDLELAKSKSNENPVYYVQYAHARICSVERQLVQRGLL